MKTANHLTDPLASERPFLTRLGLRLVAIIAGCAAAFLLAYLIMLPVMLLGQKLGPGLGSTAWGLGIFAGYQVYRQLCKRFKLKLRYRKGEEELYEKEENEVANSASSLYEGGCEQITDDVALTGNETLSEDENATEPAPEIVEEISLNENEIKPMAEPIIEEEKAPQSEEQLQKVEDVSSVSKALTDTENDNAGAISGVTKPDKAPKRRNTKRIKKICLIISAIILAVGLFFVGRFIFLRIHTKAEHEQLVQTLKNKIEDGTIKQQEIEETLTILRDCDNENSYCNYDHLQAIDEMMNMYIQYLTDYCKTNLEQSSYIAQEIFDWYNSSLRRNWNDFSDIHFRSAVKILEYAAEHGDPRSQCVFGCYYMGADFVDKDKWHSFTMLGDDVDNNKAAYWFLQAAEQGDITAMGNIGICYLEGTGVTKNEYKGCYWIQRAANLGDSSRQTKLGDLYRDGVVVRISSSYPYHYDTIIPKDITRAMYWWNLAAEGGDETAKERLQQIYD